jgi:hypothetical protein
MNAQTVEERTAESQSVLEHSLTVRKNSKIPFGDCKYSQPKLLFSDIPSVKDVFPIRTYIKAKSEIPPNGFEVRGRTFIQLARIIKDHFENKNYIVEISKTTADIYVSNKDKDDFQVSIQPRDEIDDDGYNVFVIVLKYNNKNRKLNRYNRLVELSEILNGELPKPANEEPPKPDNIDEEIEKFNLLVNRLLDLYT